MSNNHTPNHDADPLTRRACTGCIEAAREEERGEVEPLLMILRKLYSMHDDYETGTELGDWVEEVRGAMDNL